MGVTENEPSVTDRRDRSVATSVQPPPLTGGCRQQSITFTVPGRPIGKGRPRIGRRGPYTTMFTPPETVAYEGLVAHAAQQAMAGRDMLTSAVAVRMFIGCEVPASWSLKKQRAALAGDVYPTTKPDTDNVVKAIFDGCNGVAWRDDVQAVDLTLRKRYASTPRVEVWIDALEPQGSLL